MGLWFELRTAPVFCGSVISCRFIYLTQPLPLALPPPLLLAYLCPCPRFCLLSASSAALLCTSVQRVSAQPCLPLPPWLQVLPVVCVIGCVAIYWLAEWMLRRIDPDGVLLSTWPPACQPACSSPCRLPALPALPALLTGRFVWMLQDVLPLHAHCCTKRLPARARQLAKQQFRLMRLFALCCAGEKRALGPEAGGLAGWLMGLKLR